MTEATGTVIRQYCIVCKRWVWKPVRYWVRDKWTKVRKRIVLKCDRCGAVTEPRAIQVKKEEKAR